MRHFSESKTVRYSLLLFIACSCLFVQFSEIVYAQADVVLSYGVLLRWTLPTPSETGKIVIGMGKNSSSFSWRPESTSFWDEARNSIDPETFFKNFSGKGVGVEVEKGSIAKKVYPLPF